MTDIKRHYSKTDLIDKILKALSEQGTDMENLRQSELPKFEHFHTNGSQATVELADLASLTKGSYLLDVGCGIGGPLRKLADLYDISGVGIDLTEEFITAANVITEKYGLSDKLQFLVANALEIPFEKSNFDAVLIQHVGMNIENKPALNRELHRVLKKDGLLMFQELIRKKDEPLTYPAFWADTEAISFIPDEKGMVDDLNHAGFEKLSWNEITAEALGFYEMMLIAMNNPDRPRPSLGEIIHGDTKVKTENLIQDLKAGKIGVVMGVFRAI